MQSNNENITLAWNEYRQGLISFIRSKVESIEDAEDILADVFTKLIEVFAADKPPNNISAWIYHVSKNKIIDYYRAKKPLVQQTSGDGQQELAEEISEPDAIKQLSCCLTPMISALPDKYASVLLLSDIDEKKNQDIADQLGLSICAVKSRILRGREQLHASLLQCCNFDFDHKGKMDDYHLKANNSGTSCASC